MALMTKHSGATLPEVCYWCGTWNEAERGIPSKRCFRCRTPLLVNADHVLARHVALQARLESAEAAQAVREAMPGLISDPQTLPAERAMTARIEAVFALHIDRVEQLAAQRGIPHLGELLRHALVASMPHTDERLRRMRRIPDLPAPGELTDAWRDEVREWWDLIEISAWRTPLLGLADLACLASALQAGAMGAIQQASTPVLNLLGGTTWLPLRDPAADLLARWEIWWHPPAWHAGTWSSLVARAQIRSDGLTPVVIGRIAAIVCVNAGDPTGFIVDAIRSTQDPEHPSHERPLDPPVHSLLVQALSCDDDAAVIGAALALAREDVLIPRCRELPALVVPAIRALSRAGRGIDALAAWIRDETMTALVVDHLSGSRRELAEVLIEAMPRLDEARAERIIKAMPREVPLLVRWQGVQAIADSSTWKHWATQLAKDADDQHLDAMVAVVAAHRLTFVFGAMLTEGRSAPILIWLVKRLAAQPDAPLGMVDAIVWRLVARNACVMALLDVVHEEPPFILAIIRGVAKHRMENLSTQGQAVTLVLALERHSLPSAQALGRDLRRAYVDIVPLDAATLGDAGRRLILGNRGARYRAAVAELGPSGLPDLGTLAREQNISPMFLAHMIQQWLTDEPKPAILTMLSRLTATMEPDDVVRCLGGDFGFIRALTLTKLALATVGSDFGTLAIRAVQRAITGDAFARDRVLGALRGSPDEAAAALVRAGISSIEPGSSEPEGPAC